MLNNLVVEHHIVCNNPKQFTIEDGVAGLGTACGVVHHVASSFEEDATERLRTSLGRK